MLSLETPSDVWPLHLSVISYHASLAISPHPPAQKPPTVTARVPPDSSSIITLDTSTTV